MAADDVARAVIRVAERPPLNATEEIGGPEVLTLVDFVRKGLRARNDARNVVIDPDAKFFGATLGRMSLLPSDSARLASTRFDEWIADPGNQLPQQSSKPRTATAK